MKLNIPERIALLSILPAEGNIVTLRILNELKSELAFTEDEVREYGIKNIPSDSGAMITWKPELTDTKKEVKIGPTAEAIVVNKLKELDSQSRLHVSMIPLYERFVEGKA